MFFTGRTGGMEEGNETFFLVQRRESLRGPETQESSEALSRTKPSWGERGWLGGIKPLWRRCPLKRAGKEARERMETGNRLPTTGPEESSEGKSPRALGAERRPRGWGNGSAMRVTKPMRRDFRRKSKARRAPKETTAAGRVSRSAKR